MENCSMTTSRLIADAYEHYRHPLYLYIYNKVGDRDEAEDLTQDVFLRLMEHARMLQPATVKAFIYAIARNLVTDYLRRYYRKQEVTAYFYDYSDRASDDVESRTIASDLQTRELQKMRLLPPQRGKIYAMSRFQDKSVADIAESLSLSGRTVENHLRMARREVREYIRQCI